MGGTSRDRRRKAVPRSSTQVLLRLQIPEVVVTVELSRAAESSDLGPPPLWMFGMELGYLALLAGLAVAWSTSATLRRPFQASGEGLPVPVLWWGALGAVTISL